MGYPGETHDDINATVQLIRRSRFDAILMGRFFPIPGTKVFGDLVHNGELSEDYVPKDQNIPKPFQNEEKEGIWVPKEFHKGLNLFWIVFREHILLALRNPYSVIFFIRYNGGFLNVIKRLMFSWFAAAPGKEKVLSEFE